MDAVDLEAAARARAEALGEGPSVDLRGTHFTFPAVGDVSWNVLEQLDTNLREGLNTLLDGQAEKFWASEPSVLEVVTLKDELLNAYAGLLAGESKASRVSSKNASTRSRRPSSTRTQAKHHSAS